MRLKLASILASLSVMTLAGCKGGLHNFFHGAPCATCSTAGPPGYLADCNSGCGMGGSVVSGMVPGEYMDGEVTAPWGGDSYNAYPEGTIITPPQARTAPGMSPLANPGMVTPPAR